MKQTGRETVQLRESTYRYRSPVCCIWPVPKMMSDIARLLAVLVCALLVVAGKKIVRESGDTVSPNDSYLLQTYPCPQSHCDCWLRSNPRRVDVTCFVDILSDDKSFEIFNRTSFPSTMLIYCDRLDVRQSILRDGLFSSLHAFFDLKIIGCGFSDVPDGVFAGMTSLSKLFIEGARNVEFQERALLNTGSQVIEYFSVTDSGMTRAPTLCGLQQLWGVNITSNNLKTFTDTGLLCDHALPNLIYIDVTSNYLSELPNSLSRYAPSLGRFSVRDNSVTGVEEDTFGNLTDLVWLDLSQNTISSFPDEVLKSSTKLHTLFLSKNPLKFFPAGILSHLTDITTLEMEQMNLNSSVWNEIQNLTKVLILRLQANHISNINTQNMRRLKSLGLLDLSRNSISEVRNGTFDFQQNLRILNISGNVIESIEEDSFRGLSGVTKLDMKQNLIQFMHLSSLSNMSSLILLNASSNRIEHLPIFPPSLQILDLRSNFITSVDQYSFYGLHNLKGINMRFNRIVDIPSVTFASNTNLELLNIGHNNIQTVAYDAFPTFSNVSTLVLNNNNISDLGFLRYTNFGQLKTLDLSYNQIVAISQTLFSDSLEEIFISFNKISFIEGFTFAKLTKLRYVDLRVNRIYKLSNIHLTVARGNLATVNYKIAGNPFVCDCHLEWLKKVSISQGEASNREYTIRDLPSVYCKRVNYFNNGLMIRVPVEHFVCEYTDHCIFQCDCCNIEQCACHNRCPSNCSCFNSNNWMDVNIIDCQNTSMSAVPGNYSELVTWMDWSGNNLGILRKDEFCHSSRLVELYLNSSNIHTIEGGAFSGMTSLTVLDLSHNQITTVNEEMFSGLPKLSILLLNGNKINFIQKKSFEGLPSLSSISLADNLLETISQSEFKTLSGMQSLYLSGNPWSCKCRYLEEMENFTALYSHVIRDYTDLACTLKNASESEEELFPLSDLYLPDFCLNKTIIFNISHTREESVRDVLHGGALVAIVTVLTLVTVVLIIFGFVFWNRRFLKLWLYVKFGWKFGRKEQDADKNRIYDAFVSYSSHDENFVARELVPRLENQDGGRPPYKLCVHYRDFPIGASIAETIIDSVETSKRVIIVLSDNFLNSEWCQYEFQTAHHKLLEEKKNRIVMILLHDIDTNKLDHSLKDYLKTRTYVKYGDAWFWQKLDYAMPDVTVGEAENANGLLDVPDVVRNNDNPKFGRHNSVGSENGEGIMYIMENMRNFEADAFDDGQLKFELNV